MSESTFCLGFLTDYLQTGDKGDELIKRSEASKIVLKALEEIRNLPQYDPWTLVSKKLPSHGVPVLLTKENENGTEREVCIACYDHSRHKFVERCGNNGYVEISNPIAWMDSPDTYLEDWGVRYYVGSFGEWRAVRHESKK